MVERPQPPLIVNPLPRLEKRHPFQRSDRLMEVIQRALLSLVPAYLVVATLASPLLPVSPLLGISPQDAQYFEAAVIKCKDGSKSFTRDRLNDGYCDCADGTDEPGTAACPEGKFYCINVGDIPRVLFSSWVNDGICDCCDGSDEYEGDTICPNTCRKSGSVGHNITLDRKVRVGLKNLTHNLEELRLLIVIDVVFVMCLMAFCILCRPGRIRRKLSLRSN